jgi:hypothetical protein
MFLPPLTGVRYSFAGVLSHHVHPSEAVSHACQWWEKHLGEEDASEAFYPIWACIRSAFLDFLAPVSLLLEIVLFEPDPVGTAARLILRAREASDVFEGI